MIFEEKERTRTDAKKPGEDEFAFYDSIAGAAYEVYRARLNEWIAEYPDAERAEAIACFRKTGTLGYQAALMELLVHATLKRQGYPAPSRTASIQPVEAFRFCEPKIRFENTGAVYLSRGKNNVSAPLFFRTKKDR